MSEPPDLTGLSLEERRGLLKRLAGLTDEEVDTLFYGSLTLESADRMIENFIGAASGLDEVVASVGLASNLGALYYLVRDGLRSVES